MRSNFAFLHDTFPVLENFGALAEQYCYSDPNSCLLKLGMIGETIVNLVFTYDRIPLPYENTAAARIDALLREGYITRDLADVLHQLRKARNKAAHENYASVSRGKTLLQMAYGLCECFMQTYGDYRYESRPFVMPEPTAERETDGAAEQERERRLIEAAEETAKAAPALPAQERKERAMKAASQRVRSEAETRLIIDEQLRLVGWEADSENLRYSKGTRPAKGRNIAIAEWPTESASGNRGAVDYALFAGTDLLAVVEAKAKHIDIPSVLDYQCKDYARAIRDADGAHRVGTWGDYRVPFAFAANGRPFAEQFETKSGVWFQDLRKASNAPKALRGWIRPEGLRELLSRDGAAGDAALKAMSYDLLRDPDGLNLRRYQIDAIRATEKAIAAGRDAVLLAMATGTGKTRTVLGMIYRFLKAGRFRRILFLVDRNALGEQAQDVFAEVRLEDLMTLDNIYHVQPLTEKGFAPETRVRVSTVQGMVKRILYPDGETPQPSVTDYDLVIVDEAHRGYVLDREMGEDEILYRDQRDYQSKYQAALSYFEAVKIALTATPALHTTRIFGAPAFRYTYREAVMDGYLVDHDPPHNLRTRLRMEGVHYRAGDAPAVYDPATGEIANGDELPDDLDFGVEDFNRKVIVESFNRAVLEEIMRELHPESPETHGKTLIFAVTDAHADMIVDILKNICARRGIPTEAVLKITARAGAGDPKKVRDAIKHFKNERFPSVAVTVDLLTTGIDVPEITALVFLRRVKSRILFEQMLGRGTRLCPEIRKNHFEIYDPVGVYEALEPLSNMRPVAVNPGATFNQLLDGLSVMEETAQIAAQVEQIAAKLQRKRRSMSAETLEQFQSLTGGQTPEAFIENLRGSTPAAAKETLLNCGELFDLLDEKRRRVGPPVIVSDAPDELISHERGYGTGTKPEDYLDAFADFVRENVNEIAALNIVCTRPRELTRESLKSLRMALDRAGFTESYLTTALAQTTNRDMAADIISLIRRYALGSTLVSHETRIRNALERLRAAHSFTKVELNWLNRIEKYLLEESVLTPETFDEDSRFQAHGGFARIDKIFGNQLRALIAELNDYLYDDGGESA